MLLAGVTVLVTTQVGAVAHAQPITPACPRFPAGSVVPEPPDLFSSNGVLNVALTYETTVAANGNQLFCYMQANGAQSPTLHVKPGDTINYTLTNAVPQGSFTETLNSRFSPICNSPTQTTSSVNTHFHGLVTSPQCGGDNVVKTLVDSGQTFHYSIVIPPNEPPGLYWYHPHVHGIAEAAVQGGATGLIEIEGIQNFIHEVAGLPYRLFAIRDNPDPDLTSPGSGTPPQPSWDLSVNYVPVDFPNYPPTIAPIRPGQTQLWRVANTCADTVLDLQLQFNGVAQPLTVVAFDGVPTNSQNGQVVGSPVTGLTDIFLPTAARAEFLVTAPTSASVVAQLVTLNINTGPAGDVDPLRPLVQMAVSPTAPQPPFSIPTTTSTLPAAAFADVATVAPNVRRKLAFNEIISDPTNPASPTNFYITVQGPNPANNCLSPSNLADGGAPPGCVLFDPNNPPSVVSTQGTVEEWTIENAATEVHEFHFHQQHFLLEEVNGVPVSPALAQYYDMYQVGFDPNGPGVAPFPSIKVKLDFRGPDIGTFVYHCHILAHEDGGMMAILEVVPPRWGFSMTQPPTPKKPSLWAQLTEGLHLWSEPVVAPVTHAPPPPTPRGQFQVETPFGDAVPVGYVR
jgi:FtsP/CotA-like multicopper oxidase with cupredoxin domain